MIKVNTAIRRRLIQALLLLAWPCWASAQVIVQTATIEGNLFSQRTFMQVTLLNTGAACAVQMEGAVHTRSGEPVLRFMCAPFQMSTGGRTINSAELTTNTFVFGSGAAARAAQYSNRLPGGEYRFCVKVRSAGNEVDDEFCEKFIAEEFMFLDLVSPWDGDTIDEVRPALSWTMAGPSGTLGLAELRLVLVPMEVHDNPDQAIASAVPMFIIPRLKERIVPYPSGLPSLEPGHCYAWQVEQLDGARVVDRTEPWGFCVRKHKEPVQNKYVRLDRIEPGAVYEALDNKIFFRYDEPYSSNRLDCRIYGPGGLEVEPVTGNDVDPSGPDGIRSVGVNLYELDLQPYGLKPGYYDLAVRNEKGRPRTLKFHVSR